jgi:hypothetical protein
MCKLIRAIIILFMLNLFFSGCDITPIKERKSGSVYVKPTVTRTGKLRKGYVRKSVSTDKNAVKKQAKSRYYYKTRVKNRK